MFSLWIQRSTASVSRGHWKYGLRLVITLVQRYVEGVRADTEEEIYCAARALCKGPRDDWRPYPEFPLRTGGQWGRLEDFAVLARDPAH